MANCSCKTPHSSASQEKTMEGQRKTIHKLYIIIPLFCIILVYRFYVCRKLLSHNLGCGTPCGVWGVVCGRSPCCGGVGCGVRCWHHPYLNFTHRSAHGGQTHEAQFEGSQELLDELNLPIHRYLLNRRILSLTTVCRSPSL